MEENKAYLTHLHAYIGESGVGKSSLVHRFVNRDYEANREPTIGGEK